jgi:hypothetical protein
MKLLRRTRIKSAGKFAAFLHIILTAILPILLYVLVRLDFTEIAVTLVLLSKWRMLAVKMRHWPANIRANAVDIFVGLSVVEFMNISGSQSVQLVWVALYTAWLLFIKPMSTDIWIGVQSLIAQTATLIAVFIVWNEASETWLTLVVWAVTYLCARHFLTIFDEAMARASAYTWAFFSASLTWLTAHWLLFFKNIAQPAIIITVVGYGMASLYYLYHTDNLKKGVRRQFVTLMVAIVLFILVFSDWSGDII